MDFFASLVYAKCTVTERRSLWDDLSNLSSVVNGPWLVGGDFNTVMSTEERLEGVVRLLKRQVVDRGSLVMSDGGIVMSGSGSMDMGWVDGVVGLGVFLCPIGMVWAGL